MDERVFRERCRITLNYWYGDDGKIASQISSQYGTPFPHKETSAQLGSLSLPKHFGTLPVEQLANALFVFLSS